MENTMKKLLVYLKDYKKESVLGPLFKLLEATFELIVPLVMAAIIDTGVATGDKSYIMKMCMVLVLLAVIGLTCSVTAQYFAAKAAVGFATKLRHALFAHIERLSFTEMDTVGTATLITRMTSDVNQVQNGVNLVLRLFLRSPFIVFGAMVMALPSCQSGTGVCRYDPASFHNRIRYHADQYSAFIKRYSQRSIRCLGSQEKI